MVRLSSSSSFRFRPGSSAATTASSTYAASENLPGHAHGLLLLPLPPKPPSASSLAIAYKPALRAVLPQIRCHGPDSTLDIALPMDQSSDAYLQLCAPTRADQFDSVASLVTGVYDLVKNTCIENGMQDYGAKAIDVRVLLIRYDPDAKPASYFDPPRPEGHFDVVMDLPSLVKTQRHWTQLFVANAEPAAQMFKQFRTIATASLPSSITRAQILCTNPVIVPGGLVINRPSTSGGRQLQKQEASESDRPYHRILALGNFNKFDGTAKALITMAAFLLGDEDGDSPSASQASSPASSPSDSLHPFAMWDDKKSAIGSITSRPRSPRPRRAKQVRQLVLRADPSLSPPSPPLSATSNMMTSSKFLRPRSRKRIGGRNPTTKESIARAGAEFWYDRVLSFLEAIGNCDHTPESEHVPTWGNTFPPSPLAAVERAPSPLGLVHARKDGSHYLESFARTNSIVTKNGRRREVKLEVVDEVSSGAFGSAEKSQCGGAEGEGVVRFGVGCDGKVGGRGRSDSAVAGFVKGFSCLWGAKGKEDRPRAGDGQGEIVLTRS
ncbi:hypothetical protein CERZMDRAFT_80833 [Cercospora zeae-maydis SCOH1-5]|uniref:Uncharacterized protein n=1 Tax=Cercospora zeae-maydis SCOH1-5 TaxID=717836 RepID=A0A6A6FTV2_9PEZI|nr:hypothetical protein CERZMDRAFT_80833 [Cercospora zeae-maydis SCOH1-5]